MHSAETLYSHHAASHMKTFTRFSISLLCTLVLMSGLVYGQTQPLTTWSLSSGNYTLTDWLNTNPAGTYPTAMMFHMVADIDAPSDALPTSDWNCAYNLTSGARISGLGTGGLGFINTGTLVCNCNFVGAALLSLNTVGRAQIGVTWTSTVNSSGTRPYALRLQYRLNTTSAWTNVLSNGVPVEYVAPLSASGVSTLRTITATLPTICENQAFVQLRWVYYQAPVFSSGSRPGITFDDLTVSSQSTVGTATNLAIENIVPSSPSQNTAFGLRVRAVDALGAAKNLTTSTGVQIAVNSGTGSVSGTISGTIPAGSSFVDLTAVNYSVAETGVTLRAFTTFGQVLTQGLSSALTVNGPPAYFAISGATTSGYVGVPLNPITVTVYRSDNSVDQNYASTVSIARVSGTGVLTGVTSVQAVAGVAVFDNVSVSAAGSYQLVVNAPGLAQQTLPFSTAFSTPSMITDIVPQFINARTASGTCNSSVSAFPIPVFARVTFTNLTPNTTYRYNTGLALDQILTSTGGGFNIHYNANDNTYFYAAGKSLTNAGEFSTFSTLPGQTTKTIWINLVSSTNAAFQELGTIWWRVALGDNNGNLINRYQLAQTSTPLRTGVLSTQATGIVDDNSQLSEKNYVLLYDNTAGTGRPLTVALVQRQGTLVAGAETFYASRQNSASSWATFIPNTLATGVRRIEERDAITGNIVNAIISTDGRWNNVQTNPSDLVAYPAGPGGFASPIVLQTPRITISAPVFADTLCAGSTSTARFVARGMANVDVQFSSNNGASWQSMGIVPATSTSVNWTVPDVEFATQCLVRVVGVDRPEISAVSQSFVVAKAVRVVSQPPSQNLCVGARVSMVAVTTGAVRNYQWFKNGIAIEGATNALFVIDRAQFNTSGVYRCELTGYGQCGSTSTNDIHVRVARPTQIVNQTRNAPVKIGGTAVLTVEAEIPNEAISYQWFKGQTALVDDGRIVGTASNRLEIRNVNANDLGSDYYCTVVGVCGSATSRQARILTSGVFVDFAANNIGVCDGQKAVIQASAYANPATSALRLQWWYKGAPVADGGRYSGAQSSTLTIDPVTTQDIGEYTLYAELEDNKNVNTSGAVNLVIAGSPTITTPPMSNTVCAGEVFSLSVVATGAGTLSYQWTFNGADLAGQTSPTLTLTATVARAGSYAVKITTACGSITSNTVTVTVRDATTITQQPPATVAATVGQPLTITLAATGSGTVQYQWFKDGAALAGEVTPTYTKAAYALTDAGKYWCRVRSECGDKFSDTTTVTTKPGVVSVDEDGDVVAGYSVNPNPGSGIMRVQLSLSSSSHVVLTLVNMTGETVLSITDAMMISGDHSLPFNVADLASGSYQLVALVNGQAQTRSVLVIK
ncbi:MAG: hypothetical protein FGM32_01750 [Candidatus Kapabacteria bacterium]|nr:hypothetical protein [Candidatus Kapabacteria bacterium]